MAQVPNVDVEFDGDGVTTILDFDFPYQSQAEIFVSVNGVNVPYTWIAAHTVQVLPAPALNTRVRIFRSTAAFTPRHVFAAGTPFLPRYVDENANQLLYALQEGISLFDGVAENAQFNLDRAVRASPSEAALNLLPDPAERAGKLLAFDEAGQPVTVAPASGSAAQLAIDLANTVDPTKGAHMIGLLGGGTVADLAGVSDTVDPTQGVAKVGRATVTSLGVRGLLSLVPVETSSVVVAGYHAGSGYGGGHFVWSASTPKNQHDGGRIISNTVPWDGAFATLGAFLAGSGETSPGGSGCFIRQGDKVKATAYGCVRDLLLDSAPSWQAAVRAANLLKRAVYLPDFAIKVGSPATLVGDSANFSTVKVRGTFCTNANGMNVDPTRCGSVLFTAGQPALDITFNLFSNENYSIKGVGFCDQSFYPAGTPNSTNAAIKVSRGRLDGSSYRYFSDNVLEDVAFVGYSDCVHFVGLTPASVPNAIGLNYIGPTSMVRVSAANCGNYIRLTDCSLNHLWIQDFVLHGLTGWGVYLEQTSGGSGGNVNVTYRNGVFESMRGPINTAGAYVGLTSPGVYARNNLVLDCTNREYTGQFGPEATSPFFFTGNPLGYTGNTAVVISGIWTDSIAYGERNFPEINTLGSISSTVPVTCLLAADAHVLTPVTVNRPTQLFTVPNGGTLNCAVRARAAGMFDARVKVTFADGTYGYQEVRAIGQVGGISYREVTGSKSTGVNFTASQGGASDCVALSIVNNTGFTLDVWVEVENRRGASTIV